MREALSSFALDACYTAKNSVLNIRPFDLHVLGTPPAFVLSQDQTLHKSRHTTLQRRCGRFVRCVAVEHPYPIALCIACRNFILENLDGSLKNKLFVLVHLHEPTVLYSKRVPHIWLILTLLTLFSFQGTQIY
jgi:hypothetical protein